MSEQTTVDRSGWPAGLWDDEPDRLEFEHAGLPCLLNRGPMGVWCGYVAVPPGHPLHGMGYDEPDVDVHGGLTYSDKCQGPICHVPKPGEPDDVWWFGFDCGHAFDLSPRLLMLARAGKWGLEVRHNEPAWMRETYRDMGYARRETERLAEQLARVAPRTEKG